MEQGHLDILWDFHC